MKSSTKQLIRGSASLVGLMSGTLCVVGYRHNEPVLLIIGVLISVVWFYALWKVAD